MDLTRRLALWSGVLLLGLSWPAQATEPTLARLSFWLPPGRMVGFEAAYQEQLAPLLKQHGLVESSEHGRATVDSVFSRLFTLATPEEFSTRSLALGRDPEFTTRLRKLTAGFGLAGPDSLFRYTLSIYQRPVGPGTRVLAGPGRGHWQRFGVVDGLAEQWVPALLQDRSGNLWFGTGLGVSRYDGRGFVNFTTQDGLANRRVRAILEDREGNLWFGTEKGVSRYNGQQFLTFTTENGLPDNAVRAILEDRSGNLWFGTKNGASRYNGQQFLTFITESGLADNAVNAILEDHKGNLWFGTEKGVSRYNGQQFLTFTTENGLPDNAVRAILEDRSGNLWFGTKNGASRYNGQQFLTFTTESGLADNAVNAILEDRSGNLWFGTDKGASRYDGQRFVSITGKDDQRFDDVYAILEGREGNLWFGIGEEGVSRYDGEQLKTFTTADGLGHNKVNYILEDQQGNLWCRTEGGVSRYDGQHFTTFTAEDGLGHTQVGALLEDHQGNLWFGATRYDGQHFTHFTAAEGLPEEAWGLLEDRQGRIWTNNNRGMRRYEGGHFVRVAELDSLGPPLLEDRQGNLWFRSRWGSKGLFRYDGEKIRVFTMEDGLASDEVGNAFEDQEGNLWFGTTLGVIQYDGRTFKTWTTREGLAGNWVSAITQDQDGRLLFGTLDGGVSLFDGRVFQRLDSREGLADDRVYDLLQDRKGDIWIATANGLTRYRPYRIPPPIHLEGVVADQSYGPVEELSLSTSQDYLSFQFRGLSLKTRQLAYVYRLRGYDGDWKVTREEQVVYTDLPRGEYVFEVKAVDRDLTYSEKPATVKVTIHPPYGQIALIGSLGLALVGLVFASNTAIRRRRAFLREQTARLAAQEQLNKELEDELQTAHTLQMDLMPRESPQIPGFDLAGRCIPANHVGGDLYQYFQQDGKLSIALADVTGHAMEAAIPMVMFSGVLRSQIEISGPIEELFGRLNRSLHHAAGSRTFVCFAFGTIDTRTSTLRLSSAAFPYPYHFSAATGEIAELRVDAYPLGVRPDTTYQAIERQLAYGDYLVFCSDGIIEATDQTGAQFGYERTAATLRSGCAAGLSAEALLERIIQEVKAFSGEVPQGDDQTVVVLRVGEAE